MENPIAESLFLRVINMDSDLTYLIRVQGDVDTDWLEYFHDISLAVCAAGGAPPVTTICTHNADQTRVLGILNSLYNFGYPLLSVERLP